MGRDGKDLEGVVRRDGRKRNLKINPDPLKLYFVKTNLYIL
jgi:hypothetical protein